MPFLLPDKKSDLDLTCVSLAPNISFVFGVTKHYSIIVWDLTPVVLIWPLKYILRPLSYLTTPQDVDKDRLESSCQLCGHCLMVCAVQWSHSVLKSILTNCYYNKGISRLHHFHSPPHIRGIRVSGLRLDGWCFSPPFGFFMPCWECGSTHPLTKSQLLLIKHTLINVPGTFSSVFSLQDDETTFTFWLWLVNHLSVSPGGLSIIILTVFHSRPTVLFSTSPYDV